MKPSCRHHPKTSVLPVLASSRFEPGVQHDFWRSRGRRRFRNGFTLIELLVSMTVLTLLGAMFMRLTGGVSRAITHTDRSLRGIESLHELSQALQRDTAQLCQVSKGRVPVTFLETEAGFTLRLRLCPDSNSNAAPREVEYAWQRRSGRLTRTQSSTADNLDSAKPLIAGNLVNFTARPLYDDAGEVRMQNAPPRLPSAIRLLLQRKEPDAPKDQLPVETELTIPLPR